MFIDIPINSGPVEPLKDLFPWLFPSSATSFGLSVSGNSPLTCLESPFLGCRPMVMNSSVGVRELVLQGVLGLTAVGSKSKLRCNPLSLLMIH